MSIQEATLRRELTTRVDSLERQVTDLTRRMDDLSKANRLLSDQIDGKKLKKDAA